MMRKSDSRQKLAVSESSGSSGSVQFWVSRLPGAMGDLFLGISSLATAQLSVSVDTLDTLDNTVDRLDNLVDNLVDTVDIGQCANVCHSLEVTTGLEQFGAGAQPVHRPAPANHCIALLRAAVCCGDS